MVQLTQEEDQAVTNLLKLHHQEVPLRSKETLTGALGPLCSEVPRARAAGPLPLADCWSDLELEVADVLLSGFGPMERDRI